LPARLPGHRGCRPPAGENRPAPEIPRLEAGVAPAGQHAGRAEAAASRVRLIAAAGAALGALGILSLGLTAFRRRG